MDEPHGLGSNSNRTGANCGQQLHQVTRNCQLRHTGAWKWSVGPQSSHRYDEKISGWQRCVFWGRTAFVYTLPNRHGVRSLNAAVDEWPFLTLGTGDAQPHVGCQIDLKTFLAFATPPVFRYWTLSEVSGLTAASLLRGGRLVLAGFSPRPLVQWGTSSHFQNCDRLRTHHSRSGQNKKNG